MKNALRHLNALKAFEAVAKHCSMAKAAQELNVSHSVVSNHIKNLEGWLNVELFHRHANRIELTDAGKAFAPKVASGFQVLRDACDMMLQFSHTSVVTVYAEPAIASRWLRKRLSDFNHLYPDIEINLIAAWQPPSLSEGIADIVIHFEERLRNQSANLHRLFAINGFPACSPHILPLKNHPTADNNFLDLPLIHDNGREIWQAWYSRFAPNNIHWESGKVYSDLALTIDAAVDGEGVFLADPILCERELENGSLIPLNQDTLECAWYAMATQNNDANLSTSRFTDWLINNLDR